MKNMCTFAASGTMMLQKKSQRGKKIAFVPNFRALYNYASLFNK